MRPLPKRTSRAVAFARRTAFVAAIVAVTMLGNLRLQASEIGHPPSARAADAGAPVATASDPAAAQFTGRHTGGSAADPAPVPHDADDDTQLVPAIYAWDKDVRFVYYRHMSKWM